jgi:FkbM family methyltransferase
MTVPQPLYILNRILCTAMKRVVAAVIVDSAPLAVRKPLLKTAAVLPPPFKVTMLERLCARMSRNGFDREHLIVTNLGVSPDIRCRIPIHKSQYAFGCPKNSVMERATLNLVCELSNDCLHFLDVGAHEGIYTFSVFATRRKDISSHWFEPDKILSERLARNLELNFIEAHGNRVAVADTSGCAVFFRNLTDDASGSLATCFGNKHSTFPETVNTVRLSDYCLSKDISRAIVKVDVEGLGSRVWLGMERCFARITYLVIEMLAPEIADGLPQRIIRQTEWHAYYIRDFQLVESRTGEFEYVEPFWNWLFCGLDPLALARRLAGTKFRVIAPA